MGNLPNCPKCNSEYTYEDGSIFVCPECAHEWGVQAENENNEDINVIKDANGNVLQDGDSVTIIKDLKVKNIRLVPDASDGHNIDCKIDGFGAMSLKSEFVKKI